MSQLWGVPDTWATPPDGGYMQSQLDMARLGQMTAQTQLLQAEVPVARMKAAREGMQLRAQQQYLQRMAQQNVQGVEQSQNLEGQMQEMAGMEMAMGNPEKSAAILSHLGTIRNQQAQRMESQQRIDAMLADKAAKRKEDIYNMFAGVNGPEDYNQAMMLVQAKYPDEPIPRELKTYSPAAIDYVKRVTKTGWEQAKEERQDRMDAERQRQFDAREADMDRRQAAREAAADRRQASREAYEMARTKYVQDREDARKKVGGDKPTSAGTPDNNMIRAADAMIRRDFPKLPGDMALGKDQVSSAAYDVASEAKALMAANKGLSSTEAMNRVYAEYKKSGAFQTQTEKGFFTDKTTSKFTRPAKAPTAPAKVSSDEDYNALPSGTEFIGPDGKKRRKP